MMILSGCNASDNTGEATPPLTLILSTTTSVDDSGLLDYLAPYLLAEENIILEIIAEGSGKAIQTAKDSNCDIIIAHSPKSEQEFIDEGYGINRRQIMYNYFVIVGPNDDPANIINATNASEAFKSIYEMYDSSKNTLFISRDDKSGTDKEEKEIWEKANLDVDGFSQDFYYRADDKMLATLMKADELDAYTLTDKATFLANIDKLPNIKMLYEQNDELKNVYSVILINPEKYPDIEHDGARRFHAWLLKDSTQALIASYGQAEYNESLFFIN